MPKQSVNTRGTQGMNISATSNGQNIPINVPNVSQQQASVLPQQLTTPTNAQPAGKPIRYRSKDYMIPSDPDGTVRGTGATIAGAFTGAGLTAGAVASAIAAGATVGSSVPVVGTIIGAIVGAGIATLPGVIEWGHKWSTNNKIRDEVHDINKLNEKIFKNPNDPFLKSEVARRQGKINKLNPGKLAPGQELLPQPQKEAILSGGQMQPDGSIKGHQGQQLTSPTGQPQIGANGQPLQEQPGQVPGTPKGDWWGGQRAYAEQLPKFTPNQQQYQNQVIDYLRTNPADFGAIRNNEINRFKTETLPYINEQAFGKNANQSGSAQSYKLAQGGEGLAERLMSMQSQFEAEKEARNQNIALQPSYESVYHPREAGFGEYAKNKLGQTLIEQGPGLLAQGGKWALDQFSKNKNANDARQAGLQNQPGIPDKFNLVPESQSYQNTINANNQTAQQVNPAPFQLPQNLSQLNKQFPQSPYAAPNDQLNQLNRLNYKLGGKS